MGDGDSVSSDADTTKSELKSFSSPYTVQILDQIPTPILKLLVVMGPAIRHAARLVEIITWQSSSPRQSVLAVLLWIACCWWTRAIFMFGLPSLMLAKLGRDWLRVRITRARREKLERQRLLEEEEGKKSQQRMKQAEDDEQDLLKSRKFQPEGHVSLDDTLQDLVILNAYFDQVLYLVRRINGQLDGSKPEAVVSVLSVALYAWPLWIFVNWILGPSGILAGAGTLVLICCSPWFKVSVMAVRKNILLCHAFASLWAYGVALVVSVLSSIILPLQYASKPVDAADNKKHGRMRTWVSKFLHRAQNEKAKALQVTRSNIKEDEDATVQPGSRSEMIFQFEIYENQVILNLLTER